MENKYEYEEINEVLLKVGGEIAVANGMICVGSEVITPRDTGFWGNLFTHEARVKNTLYIYPEFEEDLEAEQKSWHIEKGILPKSSYRVELDMFFGKPRLNVRLRGGACAFITCKPDGTLTDAQAFGDAGPMLLMHLKSRVDELMGRETKINYNEINK